MIHLELLPAAENRNIRYSCVGKETQASDCECNKGRPISKKEKKNIPTTTLIRG